MDTGTILLMLISKFWTYRECCRNRQISKYVRWFLGSPYVWSQYTHSIGLSYVPNLEPDVEYKEILAQLRRRLTWFSRGIESAIILNSPGIVYKSEQVISKKIFACGLRLYGTSSGNCMFGIGLNTTQGGNPGRSNMFEIRVIGTTDVILIVNLYTGYICLYAINNKAFFMRKLTRRLNKSLRICCKANTRGVRAEFNNNVPVDSLAFHYIRIALTCARGKSDVHKIEHYALVRQIIGLEKIYSGDETSIKEMLHENIGEDPIDLLIQDQTMADN